MSRSLWTLIACVLASLMTAPAAAQITVRQDGLGDYTTIQEAIDNVPSGTGQASTIIVWPGVYSVTTLVSLGKNFELTSTNPGVPAVVASTIIQPSSLFAQFAVSELSNACRVRGFTFIDGAFEVGGGLTIEQCVFTSPSAFLPTPIVAVDYAAPINITGCRFEGAGTAIVLFEFDPLSPAQDVNITNTVFHDMQNRVCFVETDPVAAPPIVTFTNCSFIDAGNLVTLSAGDVDARVYNSIVAGNTSLLSGPSVEFGSTLFDTGSTVPSSPGFIDLGRNIVADPMFVDEAGGDFRLADGSPAIDSGSDRHIPTYNQINHPTDSLATLSEDILLEPRVVDDALRSARPIGARFVDEGFAIPDNTGSTLIVSFGLSDYPEIDRLEVSLEVNHTYVDDLIIELVSPQGTSVRLWNRGCLSEDNLDVTFADGEGDDPFGFCGGTTISGLVAPTLSLRAFAGENPNGTWQIRVTDVASADTGTLESLYLSFQSSHVDMGAYEHQSADDNAVQSVRIDPDPPEGAPVRFLTQFSDLVAGVDESDVSFTTTGSAAPSMIGVAPSAGLEFQPGTGSTIAASVDVDSNVLGHTLEAWLWRDRASGDQPHALTTEGPNADQILGLLNDGRVFYRSLQTGTFVVSESPVAAEEWAHVAVVTGRGDLNPTDDGMATMYINGEVAGSDVFYGSLSGGFHAQLYFGGDGTRAWDGLLDEVRLWDGPRTAEQIKRNMHQRLSGREDLLIGYWPLDEIGDFGAGDPGTNDTPDLSPLGNHGDIGAGYDNGLVTPSTGAPIDEFPEFDRSSGAGEIVIPFNAAYNIPTGLTIEATVRAGTIGPGDVARIIGTDLTGGNQGIGFGQFLSGQMIFTVYGVQDYVLNTTPFVPGEWVHVAAVFDSSSDVHFYVDGAFVGTIAGSAPIPSWSNDLLIGRTATFQRWDGNIRDVRFWNDVRTPTEIADNYAGGLVGNEAGLIGYWPLGSFDNLGVGAPGFNDVRDVSPLNNHGDASSLFQSGTDRYFVTLDAGTMPGEIGLDLSSAPDGTILDAFDDAAALTPETSEVYTIAADCAADCDGSGLLNIDDIDCFVAGFLGGDLAIADCDGTGVLNIDDVDCYVTDFLAGCP